MFRKAVAMTLCAVTCMAQDPVLRGKAELVLVPVAVTHKSGRYVRDLSREDLALYDDNVPQRIQLEDVTLPISLAIAVQTTPASAIVLDKLRKATGVIGPMITGFHGEAAVVAFGRAIQVVQPFTSKEDDVARSIQHLEVSGTGAGIADAITVSLKLLTERKEHRRVLLVLSEKHDLSSNKDQIAAAALQAQRENVTVYSVTFSPSGTQWTNKVPVYCDPPPRDLIHPGKCKRCTCGNCGNQCDREDGKPQVFVPVQAGYTMNLGALVTEMRKMAQVNSGETLAHYTGGEQTAFATKAGLDGVLDRIGHDVHAAYLVSFQPSHAEPGVFHQIRVEVKGRKDVTVRARPGYWPAPE
jgi:hypothetical protein